MPAPAKDWPKQPAGNQHSVKHREDAQGAIEIEAAKAVGCVALVVEDAGDEKAREHEKDVDEGSPVEGFSVPKVVLAKDDKHGDSAQTVEGWIGGTLFDGLQGVHLASLTDMETGADGRRILQMEYALVLCSVTRESVRFRQWNCLGASGSADVYDWKATEIDFPSSIDLCPRAFAGEIVDSCNR